MDNDDAFLMPERLAELAEAFSHKSNGWMNIGYVRNRHGHRYARTVAETDEPGCDALERRSQECFSTWSMATAILAPGLRISNRCLWSLSPTTTVGLD